MKIRFVLYIVLLSVGVLQQMDAQSEQSIRRSAQGKAGVSQDELVSFNSDVPYAKAIQSLGELSRKIDGKIIIDRSPLQGKDKAIGINIESMYWKDAFELILRSNQLWYNDYPEYMEIVSFEDVGKQLGEQKQKEAGKTRDTVTTAAAPAIVAPVTPVVVDSSEYYSKIHEVAISSVFFDINKTKLAESGVSFSIFRGKDLNLGVDISGADKVTKQALALSVQPTGGGLAVSLNAALKMFESEQLGEVIARPQITVRPGMSSTFQVGQNFSVFEKDFSGNTIQKFYPTGTILEVRPRIYKIGDTRFIDVKYRVEKSNFTTGGGTSIINKTEASGSLILLNGEEGYIGGMASNEETMVREGVPILKDLPWWVLGLRYLFGYDSKQVVKRELIVLIKAEILPSLEERAATEPAERNIIPGIRQDMNKELERKTGKKIQ
jgi:hypothetical protein